MHGMIPDKSEKYRKKAEKYMNYVGIDIGSTAAKVVVRGDKNIKFVIPTGWSCKMAASSIKDILLKDGVDVLGEDTKTVSTGYGREAVDYAGKTVTEITCHGKGAASIFGGEKAVTVIDVGGQDTKVINLENGIVSDFIMNDKCAAGTGKFIEIMANRLNVELSEMFELAKAGDPVPISSLCTVFAESEVISHIAEGRKREDIAAGIISSVALKVSSLCSKQRLAEKVVLTGGLSENEYFAKLLSDRLKKNVEISTEGRYAGALGASVIAERL